MIGSNLDSVLSIGECSAEIVLDDELETLRCCVRLGSGSFVTESDPGDDMELVAVTLSAVTIGYADVDVKGMELGSLSMLTGTIARPEFRAGMYPE